MFLNASVHPGPDVGLDTHHPADIPTDLSSDAPDAEMYSVLWRRSSAALCSFLVLLPGIWIHVYVWWLDLGRLDSCCARLLPDSAHVFSAGGDVDGRAVPLLVLQMGKARSGERDIVSLCQTTGRDISGSSGVQKSPILFVCGCCFPRPSPYISTVLAFMKLDKSGNGPRKWLAFGLLRRVS